MKPQADGADAGSATASDTRSELARLQAMIPSVDRDMLKALLSSFGSVQAVVEEMRGQVHTEHTIGAPVQPHWRAEPPPSSLPLLDWPPAAQQGIAVRDGAGSSTAAAATAGDGDELGLAPDLPALNDLGKHLWELYKSVRDC